MSGGSTPETGYREAGSGPGVVCLHCSASSSGQWRPLMDRLADRTLLEPVFERAGERFHVVGHSYDGAIAPFIDYWMARGNWAATPEPRRPVLLQAMKAVRPECHSAFNEPTTLDAFRAIDAPILLLTASASTAAARAVAAILGQSPLERFLLQA